MGTGMAGGDRDGWLEEMEMVGGNGDSRGDKDGWRGQGWLEQMRTEMAGGNGDGWRGVGWLEGMTEGIGTAEGMRMAGEDGDRDD